MATARQIIQFTNKIAAAFRPQRVIVFGSYAYGTPTEDSDVDILVVMNYRGASYRKAAAIRALVPYDISCDVLVRSAHELTRRVAMNDFFLCDVIDNGIVLYDREDPRL